MLSQASDGTTQVQWATILAPPQIGPSATLTLVVDAKDFKHPSFDLSVQPGLVTDPSVGALVDAAFQPGTSSELKLQARTIGLVGEVNTVLARAGETISKVRTTLDCLRRHPRHQDGRGPAVQRRRASPPRCGASTAR